MHRRRGGSDSLGDFPPCRSRRSPRAGAPPGAWQAAFSALRPQPPDRPTRIPGVPRRVGLVRWCSVVLLALGVLTAQPAAANEPVLREMSERTVEARGLRSIEIVNSRGRVDLLPSTDGKIHVTALKLIRYCTRTKA